MVHTMPAARVVEDVRDVVRMPWGGTRNLALRAALLPIADDLVVQFIDQQGSIQTRSVSEGSARRIEAVLRRVVSDQGVTGVFARDDGQWVAYGHFPID